MLKYVMFKEVRS